MARRDEKFLRIRHSCLDTVKKDTHYPAIVSCFAQWMNLSVDVSANLSDVYPALDDPRSDVRSKLSVLQNCSDHAGRHSIKLRDSGANGGGAVLVVLLIPLGPDRAQAVVRNDFFKQELDQRDGPMLAW